MTIIRIAAILLAMVGIATQQRAAVAQAYPSKPVKLIVPYAPGGPTDIIARILAQKLAEGLGGSFFVENTAGAGGTIATGQAANAATDGTTILVANQDFWEEGVNQLRHPRPCDPILLTATPQRSPPEIGDIVEEHVQYLTVGRHCVIVEVAADDSPQPFPLIENRPVHALAQLLFNQPELRPHAVPPGLPSDLEFPRSGFTADEGEAQKIPRRRGLPVT